MNLKEKISAIVMEKVLEYIAGNPEENLPKLLKWADEFDRRDNWKGQRDMIREVVGNPDNNWYQYIMRLFQDIDNDVLKSIFRNFLMNLVLTFSFTPAGNLW